MKKIGRIFSLLLVIAMLVALAVGCGTKNGSASKGGEVSKPADSGKSSAVSSGKEEEPAAEPYTVQVMLPNGTGKSLADEAMIEEAINAITVPEINCKVDLYFVGFGQYSDQVTLMLASGEKMDLFLGMGINTDTSYLASTGQIVPIGDSIDKYGEGIKAALGDYYKAGMNQDGNIYTVACIRDMAYSNGLIMRKDIMDKAGINIDDINSFEDIGEMCAKIRETGAWDGAILDYVNNLYYYDGLGNDLGVIVDMQHSLKVVNLYETEEFKSYMTTIRQWYLDGYIDPEADTSTDNADTKAGNGVIAGWIMSNKPGLAKEKSVGTGHELISTTWGDTITSTTQVNFVTWQVAHNTEDVDSCIKVLNMMYSDERVVNLINYGIEGVHYVKNADGTVKYPEGINNDNTGWTFDTGWMLGNQFLCYMWEGNDPDLWKNTDEFNKSAELPLAFGFSANMDKVSTEVAACSAVVNQYIDALYTGSLDVETAIPELNQKLYASGLQKIIDEKQSQLDAWAAANGVAEK